MTNMNITDFTEDPQGLGFTECSQQIEISSGVALICGGNTLIIGTKTLGLKTEFKQIPIIHKTHTPGVFDGCKDMVFSEYRQFIHVVCYQKSGVE